MALDIRKTYAARAGTAVDIDAGLRSYMLGIYNYMASALALTGIVAVLVASSPALYTFVLGTPFKWVAMLGPLAFVFALSAGMNRMKLGTVQLLFWLYAASMGLSLSSIFLVFSGESIARAFFITAATFGAMSLYGYTTKRSLAGMGSFLFMGLIGLVIAMVVNIFLGSSALQFAISVVGVLIFTGLTAYDTQQLKQMYVSSDGTATMGKKKVMGALRLYLDFINLFVMLLHLFGQER